MDGIAEMRIAVSNQKCALFVLLFVSVTISTVFAEDKGEYTRALSSLKKKISRIESDLQSLRKESQEAGKRLQSVENELESLRREESKNIESLKEISSSIESFELQIQDITAQIALKKDSFSKRVTHMYKSRRKLSSISFLLVSTELNSFYRRADYMKRLVENDNEQIQEYRILLETLSLTTTDLERVREEEIETQSRLASVRKSLLPRQLESARLVRELETSMKKKEKLLESYRKEESELENIIQKLTGGEKSKGSSHEIQSPAPAFLSLSLPFPVESATVVQHFGKQKHDEFSDVIFVKGIEVSTPEGTPVKVVSDGIVVFNSELPGFGNVVIVEHPGEYYTLYGRILPEKFIGERVESMEIIGRSGVPDVKGRNFYFEIRKEGKPLNPEKYLVQYH